MTNLKRKNLKKDNSEKENSENDDAGKGKLEIGQF